MQHRSRVSRLTSNSMRRTMLFATPLFALALMGMLAMPLAAQAPAESAQELVRKVIARELEEDAKPSRYIVRLRREGRDGSSTRDIVDTREGLVSRLIAQNDQPISAEERARDDRRLEKLRADPGEQRKR